MWDWLLFTLALILLLSWLLRRNYLVKQHVLVVLLLYGEMYGLEIAEAVKHKFGYKPGFGIIYPKLRQLERKGLVASGWSKEHYRERGGTRRRYYWIARTP